MSNTQKIIRISLPARAGSVVRNGIVAVTPATLTPELRRPLSVVIVTEKGSCDRAYRYPIRISKGA